MADEATKVEEPVVLEDAAAREAKYKRMIREIGYFLEDYKLDRLGVMSILCYYLKTTFKSMWFVGFYMVTPRGGTQLMVGPYQGDVLACGIIPFGKGVCGAAAATRVTQIVDDVTKCDNYIACDADTRSEVVVPVFDGEELIAVLDIDSTQVAAFSEVDKEQLERMCSMFLNTAAGATLAT